MVWDRAKVGGFLFYFGIHGNCLRFGMLTPVVTDCLCNSRSLWLHALVIEAVYFTELVVDPRAKLLSQENAGIDRTSQYESERVDFAGCFLVPNVSMLSVFSFSYN